MEDWSKTNFALTLEANNCLSNFLGNRLYSNGIEQIATTIAVDLEDYVGALYIHPPSLRITFRDTRSTMYDYSFLEAKGFRIEPHVNFKKGQLKPLEGEAFQRVSHGKFTGTKLNLEESVKTENILDKYDVDFEFLFLVRESGMEYLKKI